MIKVLYKITLLSIVIISSILLYQKHTYAYHTLVHIDPIPHTKALIKESHYMDAYEYLNYFISFDYVKNNPQAHQLLAEIEEKRDSLSYQSDKMFEGIRTGTSDEVIGQVSAIGSDFFVVGDIRDLFVETKHYLNNEKVDTLLFALSGIGLVATVGTVFSAGSAAVAKAGISVLKLAQKSKRIPSWLSKFIIRESKQIRKTKNISSLNPLFQTLKTLQKHSGLSQTLKLLSQTSSLKELQKLTNLTKRYGKNTSSLLKLSDKQILIQANKLKHIDTKTIELASSYGKSGFSHLLKGGGIHFLKTTKRLKAYAKIGYKGEIWKLILWSMKHINDLMLITLMLLSSLLLLPFRKLIPTNR
jgi:hypothetical protein